MNDATNLSPEGLREETVKAEPISTSFYGEALDELAVVPFVMTGLRTRLDRADGVLTAHFTGTDSPDLVWSRQWVAGRNVWNDDPNDSDVERAWASTMAGIVSLWLPGNAASIDELNDEEFERFTLATNSFRAVFTDLFSTGWRLESRMSVSADNVPSLAVTGEPPAGFDSAAWTRTLAPDIIPLGMVRMVWSGAAPTSWGTDWTLVSADIRGVSIDASILDRICHASVCAAPAWTVRDGIDLQVARHSDGASMPASVLDESMTTERCGRSHAEAAEQKAAADRWADGNEFGAAIEPATVKSVRQHLKALGQGPAGYYVLGFSNGDCYVGQSVDIARRLQGHRAVRRDIRSIRLRPDVAVDSAPDRLKHLLAVERGLIHSAQNTGLSTRNKAEMTYRPGAAKIDEVLARAGTSAAQWLADPTGTNAELGGSRVVDIDRSAVSAGDESLARLRERSGDLFGQTLAIQRAYVSRCLPLAAQTELEFWVVSTPLETPKWGTLSSLSVGWTEALRINHDFSGWVQVNGVELLGEGGGDEAIVCFMRQHPGAYIVDAPHRDSGAFNVDVHAPTLDVLADLLDDAAVTRAAATAALHLMRARKVGRIRNSHNYVLAGELIEQVIERS